MKTITWQFCANDSFISKNIQWKNDSEFSHVDVVTPDGRLLGAHVEDGVQVRPLNYTEFTAVLRVTVPVTELQHDTFWSFVNSKVGCRYDKAAIAGILLGTNLSDEQGWFCSELQAQGVKAADLMWIAKASSKIDPETFRLLVTALPGAKEERVC